MSGHHEGPRAGSRAHIALQALHAIGGQSRASAWQSLVRWPGGRVPGQSDWDVIVQSLITARLTYERGGVHVITDDGLEWLGIPLDAAPCVPPVLVAPRYVAPIRPLSRKNMPNVRLQREGSFDYREIPSLQGSARVEFKTSLKVACGDAQG